MLITQASTNYVRPTCKEKQVLTSPYYLVKFQHSTTKVIRYCICSDSSPYVNRYQKLTIVETSTPTVSTNQVKLDKVGFWSYFIYEQSSSANIDPSGLNEVERGLAYVLHTRSTMSEYTSYPSTIPSYSGY
jgi:hypothetical protein